MTNLINKTKAFIVQILMQFDKLVYKEYDNIFTNRLTKKEHYYFKNFGCERFFIRDRYTALRILNRRWRPLTIRHMYMKDINQKFPK